MGPAGNGHAAGNGLERQVGGPLLSQQTFTEDEGGATLDSGEAVCRFNTQEGGRLQRWQWRTVPPPDALNPATRHDPPPLLDLVDPVHGALVDHFLPLGTKPQEVMEGTHREFGDFVDGTFRSQVVDSGGEIRIGMLRDGAISTGKRSAEVHMAKSAAIRPGASDIAVLYRVINSSLRPMQILFAVEFNLYAPGLSQASSPGAGEGYFLIDGERPDDPTLGSFGVSPGATHLALVNPVGEMALQVGWDRECDLWRMPPAGDDAGARIFTVWRIQLPPRDNWAMGLWLAPG
ncbi:MAG TPA: alpha-amylase/4-alpha-glucanotransferase domain-containing protein [Chloroflexia bacterium]|nr:alpha-amylase/4-alpha-glucanotransferase domain-containing protein [Chloroflexia bacterium]